MMKVIIMTFFLFGITFLSYGNDGMYLTRGGLIYPTEATLISMDKEVLSFKVIDRVAYVNIQFEFNNPENVERKVLIGFQAPSGGGDIPESMWNKNHISDFTIIQNQKILPYKLMVSECEDCELKKKPVEIQFSQSESGVFVFLFEVTFTPGINIINHSYNFPASHNVAIDEFYDYILTTGSKWANNTIKDLTLNFDMGKNTFFYVSDVFGKKAEWSVIGSGKITDDFFDYDEDSLRMVRILSGNLQIKLKDFKPTKNIQFGIIDPISFSSWPLYYEGNKSNQIVYFGLLSSEDIISKKNLKRLRNTIYAQYNYAFQSQDLKSYFSQFSWYMPDPNLKMKDIVLTSKEQDIINEILKREKN